MKRRWTHSVGLMISVVLFASSAFGQFAIPSEMTTTMDMNQMAPGMGTSMVYGSTAPPGRIVGDVYLDSAWHVGNILLPSGAMLRLHKMRYDLKSETLEFQTSTVVRLLDCKMIRSVAWKDKETTRYFINAASYTQGNEKLAGLLEVLADGTKPLLRRTTLHVMPSNYTQAFDSGSRDAKFYKNYALFYAADAKLYALKNKRDILEALSDKGEQVEAFVKTNDLNLRNDSDVTRVFEYYNSLIQEKSEP